MFWAMVVIIVVSSVIADSYNKRLKHKEKVLKIEQDLLQKQIELEYIKNETFKLETEKLRLELSEDFRKSPTKSELLDYTLEKKN